MHGGGQKMFRSLCCELPLLSHFQNDGATVGCSTSPGPVSNAILLELKQGERKVVGKGWRQVLDR